MLPALVPAPIPAPSCNTLDPPESLLKGLGGCHVWERTTKPEPLISCMLYRLNVPKGIIGCNYLCYYLLIIINLFQKTISIRKILLMLFGKFLVKSVHGFTQCYDSYILKQFSSFLLYIVAWVPLHGEDSFWILFLLCTIFQHDV